MIVVIDDDPRRRDISEAILAKLRFAVAPFESADQAISAMHDELATDGLPARLWLPSDPLGREAKAGGLTTYFIRSTVAPIEIE